MRKFIYETHRPTSPLRKVLLAADAAVTAFRNPKRDDAIAVLGETTGSVALERMRNRMRLSAHGRAILRDRPIISENTVNLEDLKKNAKPGSLGHGYVRFMDSHGFSPDERKAVHYVDDEELAYVMRRYREVHDFWHVLLGLDVTVRGELALKWFELVQTELPMNALSALVGPLSLSFGDAAKLWSVDVPWALRAGRESEFLMNVPFETLLEEDLGDLRERLRISAHPDSLFY